MSPSSPISSRISKEDLRRACTLHPMLGQHPPEVHVFIRKKRELLRRAQDAPMELRSNSILSTWNWSAIRLGRLYPMPSRGTFRGAESEWVMTRLTHSRLSINSSFTPRLFPRRGNFPLPGADLSFDHSILGIPSASDGCKCPAELRRLVQCLPNSFKNVNVKAALKSIFYESKSN